MISFFLFFSFIHHIPEKIQNSQPKWNTLKNLHLVTCIRSFTFFDIFFPYRKCFVLQDALPCWWSSFFSYKTFHSHHLSSNIYFPFSSIQWNACSEGTRLSLRGQSAETWWSCRMFAIDEAPTTQTWVTNALDISGPVTSLPVSD